MANDCERADGNDAVERMIARILRGVCTGPLLGSALVAAGCAETDPNARGESDFPVVRTDGGADASGIDEPTTLPPGSDAGAHDAERPGPSLGSPETSCDDGIRVLRASELKLARAFDYVGIRTTPTGAGPSAEPTTETWTRTNFITVSESGTACSSAATSECGDKAMRHPEELVSSYCVQACSEVSLVTTEGERVERWATDAELREVIGAVDSAAEALFLVMRAGYRDGCAKAVADGYEVAGTNYRSTCPVTFQRVTLHVGADGTLTPGASVLLPDGPHAGLCIGRTPAALRSESCPVRESALGDYLAACAHLEDASVHAFERLAAELTAHEAPSDLIRDARRAADDEVRHARAVAALALARKGVPKRAEVTELPVRTLEEIAHENAVEGFVRETYGALVGGYQALTAADAELRAAMGPIARDEARHAALSHRVHLWAMSQLESTARDRVRAAQRRAIAALTEECEVELATELRAALGLPTREVARAFLRELEGALWDDALVRERALS